MIEDSLLLWSQHSDGLTLILQYTLSKERWCCIKKYRRGRRDKTAITTHLLVYCSNLLHLGLGFTHNAQSHNALPVFDGSDFASLISVSLCAHTSPKQSRLIEQTSGSSIKQSCSECSFNYRKPNFKTTVVNKKRGLMKFSRTHKASHAAS